MAQQVKRPRPAAQNPGRMLGSGMNSEDWIELTKRTECNCECVGQSFVPTPEEEREDFVLVADEIGDRRYAYAQEQEALGNLETACSFYGRACACYRVADYGIEGITDEKRAIYKKIPDSFQRHYALDPHTNLEVLSIPFEGKDMLGYLAIPDGCDPDTPVLIFIAGATGFAEENFLRAKYFYDRGIPVITFDGPGQGTSLYYKDMWLTVDNYVDAVREVIKYVRSDDRIGDTVALYGISYGGFLATQAACALDDDICGVIVRGGTDKNDTLTRHPWAGVEDFYLRGFLRKFNVETLEECAELSHAQDVTDQLHKITKPLLVLHSREDPILGVEGAKRIYAMASSEDKHYEEYDTNSHCVTDMDDSASAFCADWMKPRMLAAAKAAKQNA